MLGHRTTTSARTLLALLLAATTLIPATALGAAADESPGGSAEPTITVTPDTGLVDHQVVTVEGSGFVPNRRVEIMQCPPRPVLDTCEPSLGSARADEAGHFSVQVGVDVLSGDIYQEGHDCRRPPGRCTIRTYGGVASAKAPITFDPDADPAPPPQAVVTPGDGVVDAQIVDLTVTGLRPGAWVTFLQCVGTDPQLDDCEPWPLEPIASADSADLTGRIETPLRVRTIVQHGERSDCRMVPCSIRVADEFGPSIAAALTFDPGAALAPRATAVAAPSSGLEGRQVVHLTGAGFFTGEDFGWLATECTLPVPGVFPDAWSPTFACDDRVDAYGTTEEDGTFEADVTVRSVIRSQGRQVADCRRQACGLVVLRAFRGHRADQVVVPLTFTAPAR